MNLSFSLKNLGATPEVCASFTPYADQGLTLARVSLAIRGEYRLLDGENEYQAEATGALFYLATGAADLPAVGDWVAARVISPSEAIVQAVLPRRSCFSRRAAGNREDEQIIAANIDTVFLVSGLDHDFNLRRVERYLTLAHESRADPVIVLNKADLCPDPEAIIATIAEIAAGVPIVAISARDHDGLEPIRPFLAAGRTVALLGSSGVGKSTLVNQLAGNDKLQTAAVREADSRGRHTTTHRELIVLPDNGGVLIDNPGMREIQLWAGEDSLDETFNEIATLAQGCRFPDCRHESEPGCAVRAALEVGQLDADRWTSYLKLRAEIRYHEVRSSHNAAAAQKQKWKVIHKAMRHYKKHW